MRFLTLLLAIVPPLVLLAAIAGGCGGESTAPIASITGDPPRASADGSPPVSADDPPRVSADDPPRARRETLEALRESVAAPRSAADGGGRAWLETEDGASPHAVAGRPGTWTIVYEAGPRGVAEGGYVRLTVSGFWGWSVPQVRAPQAPGYTTVETTAEGVVLETAARDWLDIVVTGRPLAEGEQVRIVYGAGPAGAMADRFAETGSRFWIGVDGDGDGISGLLVDSPSVTVAPGHAARLRVTLPSTARPGDEVRLRAAVLDGLGNRGVPFVGELRLSSETAGLRLPATVAFTAEDAGVKAVELEVVGEGAHRIQATLFPAGAAEDAEPVFTALSNPILVAERNARILWADLHGHSNLSDGTGTPDEFLRYARDVAGLDVVCLTDHDHWGMLALDQYPALWDEIRTATEAMHDPGSFVTILGYEWTSWIHGHRHVLYFEGEGKVLSSIDPAFETPAQLWDGLRGQKAMTFAHHSAGGPIATNWDYLPDPAIEPVTEITSVHGCSEALDAPHVIYSPLEGNFVRDVLDRGVRLGFVGSGDSHDGHPGFADIASGGQGSGLAAILAEDLTREGVYEALFARRCYATNGARIVLRAALNGHRMGETVPAPAADEEAILYLRVLPEAPLDYLDVVRRAGVVRREFPAETWHFEGTFAIPGLEKGEYVYVRAVQTDGGAAWSSPFFIE